MQRPHVFFVTGKGGVGKTTVAAALAAGAARDGQRVLIVELAADRGLASLFGKRTLRAEPTPLAAHLHAVRIDTRALVEAYFTRLLRLPMLTRRLFASSTFNAVTTAAPGVTEFLVLESILQWIEPGMFSRKRPYDLIIVDGWASGHALRLLRTPRQLASMIPGGPIGSTARKLLGLLADHAHTHVLLVTLPDEMAVNETLESHAVLAGDLALHVLRPVLNRVFARRFTASDAAEIAALGARHAADPLLAAARLQLSHRHDAERHLSRLRRGVGQLPICIRQVCSERIERHDLEQMGATLTRALFGAPA